MAAAASTPTLTWDRQSIPIPPWSVPSTLPTDIHLLPETGDFREVAAAINARWPEWRERFCKKDPHSLQGSTLLLKKAFAYKSRTYSVILRLHEETLQAFLIEKHKGKRKAGTLATVRSTIALHDDKRPYVWRVAKESFSSTPEGSLFLRDSPVDGFVHPEALFVYKSTKTGRRKISALMPNAGLTLPETPRRDFSPWLASSLSALAALHARGAVHRDIARANILLQGPKATFCDPDPISPFEDDPRRCFRAGRTVYSSPEVAGAVVSMLEPELAKKLPVLRVFTTETANPALQKLWPGQDVWSLAACYFVMITNEHLFGGKADFNYDSPEDAEYLRMISETSDAFVASRLEKIDDEKIRHTLKAMLQVDPTKRANASQALKLLCPKEEAAPASAKEAASGAGGSCSFY